MRTSGEKNKDKKRKLANRTAALTTSKTVQVLWRHKPASVTSPAV